MSCSTCNNKNCNNSTKCGCTDSYLTSPLPCPTPVDCPEAQPCSETFDSQCIIYTGDNIICDTTVVVNTDTNIEQSLNSIVDYFCTEIANIPVVIVEAGEGIEVVPTVVGTTTTYTVSTTGVRKYVQSFDNVVFENVTLTVLGLDLAACGLITLGCSNVTSIIESADFVYNIMFFNSGLNKWISLMNEPTLLISSDVITGNITFYIDTATAEPFTVRITIIG
jgi:hypothetical protein